MSTGVRGMQANTREAVTSATTESPCQVVDICAYNAMGSNGERGCRQPARRGCVTMRYVPRWYRGNIYTPYGEDSRSEARWSLDRCHPWPRGPDDGKALQRSVMAAAGSGWCDRRRCRGLSGRASAGRVATTAPLVVVKRRHVHGTASSGSSRRFRLQAWRLRPVQSWTDAAGRRMGGRGWVGGRGGGS